MVSEKKKVCVIQHVKMVTNHEQLRTIPCQVVAWDGKNDNSEYNIVSIMRQFLVMEKILGAFPAKNVIVRRPGAKLQKCIKGLEGIWSFLVSAFMISLASYWLQHIDVADVVDPSQQLKRIDYLIVHTTATLSNAMNMLFLFMGIALTSRWIELLEDFNKVMDLLEDSKSSILTLHRRYRVTHATFVTIYAISCCINSSLRVATVGIHLLFTLGGILEITILFLILLMSNILQLLFKSYANKVKRVTSTEELAVCAPAIRTSRLENLRNLHCHLHSMVAKASAAWGWLLFVDYTQAFASVILFLYNMVSGLTRPSMQDYIFPFTLLYLAFLITRLVSLSSSVEAVTLEVNSSLVYWQKISLAQLAPESRREVNMMIHKLSCDPPVITAANFFTINRRLLTSAAGAITTYLVILVQFQMSESPVNEITTTHP